MGPIPIPGQLPPGIVSLEGIASNSIVRAHSWIGPTCSESLSQLLGPSGTIVLVAWTMKCWILELN